MLMKEGEKKTELEESPQGDLKEQAEETVEAEDHEKKEIPLDEMTRPELLEKIYEVQGLAGKNYDLYLRSQAEIENLRKRFQKDKEDLIKFSNEFLIRQLLVVVDNLEKAVDHGEKKDSIKALSEGVDLTLKGLMDTLKKTGLETVKALNEPFDPNLHEAVLEQEDDSVKGGTVIQELQKGYLLNKRLIRPSMVIVSKSR